MYAYSGGKILYSPGINHHYIIRSKVTGARTMKRCVVETAHAVPRIMDVMKHKTPLFCKCEKRGFTEPLEITIALLNLDYFLALAAGFLTVFFAATFIFFALTAAALPFTMGFFLQQIISPTAQPHASSTATTRPHTSQVNKSPFLKLAMLLSLLRIFFHLVSVRVKINHIY